MVHLVDEDGEVGQPPDDVAQLVGLLYLLQLFFAEERWVFVVSETVEDDFLGIGDGHEPHEIVQGLVVVDLLRIRVLDLIALACTLLLIEDLELDEPGHLRGGWLRDDP